MLGGFALSSMSIPQRTFDRALVAKLSDARERLHDLLARANAERTSETVTPVAWPRDINEVERDTEVSCG
jgi:hypothetical protein